MNRIRPLYSPTMPAMPKDMSWLSPKRRRTTGNLQNLPNGQIPNGNTNVNGGEVPSSPLHPPSVPQSPTTSMSEKRPKTGRPVSQPQVRRATSSSGPLTGAVEDSGNLFYAYARKVGCRTKRGRMEDLRYTQGDDLKSRYLLTFASATIANEWWLHVQHHFPDSTRPGPQLFSFKTEDLLAKAWKHPSLEHLKSKWMYIAFSDATGDVGGAAQGIIPIQDAEGHMLGSSAGRESGVAGELKKEAKEVKNDVHRLEEHFEKMMEAVEKNTHKVAELAGVQHTSDNADYIGAPKISTDSGITYFDMDVLSGHFGRMNELLAKNNEHIDGLVRKHDEHEQQLRGTIQILASTQKNESMGLQHLTTHLDRMQQMMESSITERADSAKDLAVRTAPSIDFSPLADRLEKVQEAVEQNSALIKALLDEATGANDSKSGMPFWGKEQAPVDLLLLTSHLERIYNAIEQQTEQSRALAGFAGGDREAAGSPDDQRPASLAPLVAEHLEQIFNAIEEGNKNAVGSREDLRHLLESSPTKGYSGGSQDILKAFEESNKHNAEMKDYMQRLYESQIATRKAIEKGNKHSSESKDHLQKLLESQHATREAIEANGGEIDFTPMAEHLESIREASDTNAETIKRLLETQHATHKELDFSPLTDHLGALRSATDQSNERMRELVSSQQRSAKSDFTPVTDRLRKIHTTLEKQASERREASPGTGDAKFVMNALSSHLSKIQAVTEQNANHVRSLREKQSSEQVKMHVDVAETSEQVRSLVGYASAQQERIAENERRIEQQNAQMREMMSGQREMVEVMRSLARSVTAQSKGACDHVVVPPPRKMGRKVVGFVYDAKENGG